VRLLEQALDAARAAGHPRLGDLSVTVARLRLAGGRPDGALAALDGIGTDVAARPEVRDLRARALEALGRPGEAMRAWASMPAPDADAALDGRLRTSLALGDAAGAGAVLEAGRARAAAAGREDEVLRIRSMQAALWWDGGRENEAIEAWRGVAATARAAGAPALGLQARAHLATTGLGEAGGREAVLRDLAAARDEAVALLDPASYALVCAALADVQVADGRDLPAVDTAFRARAALKDLLGDAGTAVGDALVRRVSRAMGAGRWDRALDGFIAARKAGEAVQDA
jgi:hypothetical protein